MSPIPLNPIANKDSFGALWWSFDELQDTDVYVLKSMMVSGRKMSADRFVLVAEGYVPEVVDKPVLDAE